MAGIGGLLIGLLILLLARLPIAPWPWFDEGLNVGTAATLLRAGAYALPDGEALRIFDPAIQTGPTVIVPVALAFAAFGVGFTQARLVIVAFALIAVVGYWLLARRLLGRRAGWLAVALLAAGTAEPMASFIPMSRQVLGEVPALAYLLLGMLIWLRAVERRRPVHAPYLLAGLAWGIAMVTKSQVLITLPIAILLLGLIDRLYYRQAGWMSYLVPLVVAAGCVGAWYLAQVAIGGASLFMQNLTVLREGSRLHTLGVEPAHWRNAAGTLWRTGFWAWGPPALLWGCWKARERSLAGLQHAAPLIVALTMLIWFLGFSIGWERYLFFPAILAPIWLAGLLGWLGAAGTAPAPRLRAGLALLLGALLVLANGQRQLALIVATPESGFQAMRSFLSTQVPAGATIATWEWELALDGRHAFMLPATEVANAYTAALHSGRAWPPTFSAPPADRPDYILVGGFNTLTGFYTPYLGDNADRVAGFGSYQLFRVRPAPSSAGSLFPQCCDVARVDHNTTTDPHPD